MISRLQEIFSIDVRSLAIVRIGLAAIVLFDLATRLPDIAVFYGDTGAFPTHLISTFWTGNLAWSLHALFGGAVWWMGTLFFVQALAAVALLVGYRTTIAAIVTWFLLTSLHNTNPLILQGEDVLLRVVLFVCMFLPLGAVWSIDAMRRAEGAPQKVLSGWTIAYLFQIAFLYFFASIYKHSPVWFGGDAIFYALNIDTYVTSFGKFLLQFPSLLTFLDYSILIFQSFALFLIFTPFWSAYIRTLTVFCLMFMHAMLAASLHVGMFSSVCIVALTGLLPGAFWDAIKPFFLKFHFRLWVPVFRKCSKPQPISAPIQALLSFLGILYLAHIFLWQAGNALEFGQYNPFTYPFDVPAKVLRLDQRWNLFAPYPVREDGWLVAAVSVRNGESVDVFREGASVSYEKPENVFSIYPNPRWRRFVLHLWNSSNARYRPYFADYFCHSWNSAHSGEYAAERVDLVYMLERTEARDRLAVVQPTIMTTQECI